MLANRVAYITTYHGEKAVELTWGRYKAVVLPNVGGNLVAFRDTERDFRFLHEPLAAQMSTLKQTPYLYGIPVLFPPNRYDAGTITFDGRTYHFPINERERNNHLHGFLYDIPWKVEDYGVNRVESFVTLSQRIDSQHPVYQFWPHKLQINLHYSLNELGLQQHVVIKNLGSEKMPCLIGFHTAVNAPFAANTDVSNYRFKVTVGNRWELDERGLPTGRFMELDAAEKQMQSTGVFPFAHSMDNHYTAVPQNGRNRMELTDLQNRVKLIYDVGNSFRQWMVWNNSANPGFFCAEPQVNLVNAPNVGLPSEDIGLFSIEPGETWEEVARIYCKEL